MKNNKNGLKSDGIITLKIETIFASEKKEKIVQVDYVFLMWRLILNY